MPQAHAFHRHADSAAAVPARFAKGSPPPSQTHVLRHTRVSSPSAFPAFCAAQSKQAVAAGWAYADFRCLLHSSADEGRAVEGGTRSHCAPFLQRFPSPSCSPPLWVWLLLCHRTLHRKGRPPRPVSCAAASSSPPLMTCRALHEEEGRGRLLRVLRAHACAAAEPAPLSLFAAAPRPLPLSHQCRSFLRPTPTKAYKVEWLRLQLSEGGEPAAWLLPAFAHTRPLPFLCFAPSSSRPPPFLAVSASASPGQAGAR
mmetsp:Transcript_19160/g.49107  ORF Transcript_19160/g.49107 Transcript_19160/m.49107 type:complete len:256 (-) Transcript_19160:4369-5136(-)